MSKNISINHFCDEQRCPGCCTDLNIELEESFSIDAGTLNESNAKLN
jgi:hypothetical protein